MAQQQGGLEEIIVTARFREENLQQTPLAITAFSGENLEARNLTDVTQIDTFSPNTIIPPLGAGWGSTAAAFIRGIGLGDNSLSFEPGVPIYIDDVYHGRPQGAILDLLDLERVEMLRGPQGTLFGKNAIGGTIRLVSRKPEGDNTGDVEVKLGSYDRIDLRGSYDIALVPDKVYARFSASSKQADGYFDILDYECVNGPGSLGRRRHRHPAGRYAHGVRLSGAAAADRADQPAQPARPAGHPHRGRLRRRSPRQRERADRPRGIPLARRATKWRSTSSPTSRRWTRKDRRTSTRS